MNYVGLKLFFDLADTPKELALGDTYNFRWKMSISEPKDYNEWGSLVSSVLSYLIDRYGLDEVKT